MKTKSSDNKAVSLDEYIETERSGISASRLRQLSEFTVQLQAKLETEQARQHYDLHECVHILITLLESEEIRDCKDPLPQHLAEAGVAANYLLKGVDMIPDWVPEIGLTDDARLIAAVFSRNPKLAALQAERRRR